MQNSSFTRGVFLYTTDIMYSFIVHRLLRIPHRLHIDTDPASAGSAATIVFIHGIGSSHRMWRKTIAELRAQPAFAHYSFISVDLLGFGKSPKPTWATYNASFQATSLYRTLRLATKNQRTVFVGHSLGALVAIEYAKRHGDHVDRLYLCSPPFYRPSSGRLPTRNSMLQKAYEEIAKHPARTERVLIALRKYTLVNEGYSIDETNAPIFLKTLTSSIINQTAYDDALALSKPTCILSGMLDPVVIESHIASLAKQNPSIVQKRIALAAHEVSPLYRKELVKILSQDAGRG